MNLKQKAAKIALPLLFWGTLWNFLALRVGQALLLPSPLEVGRRFLTLAGTGPFWLAVGYTLHRIFWGMLWGTLLGTVTAGLGARFTSLDWILAPAVKVIRATPVVSFILLIWLWAPTGRVPQAVTALMVLPVIWGSVRQGIQTTDPKLLELASDYRFSSLQTLRLIYVPSVRPAFSSGCRTALGLAWKAGVAAEVLCLPKNALGTQVYYSKLYLETSDLFAWTAAVIFLSFLVERGLGAFLERRAGHGIA